MYGETFKSKRRSRRRWPTWLPRALALSVAVVAVGCGSDQTDQTDEPRSDVRSAAVDTRGAVEPDPARESRDDRGQVVVLGDSLTAGLGLPVEDAFPSVLQRRIDEAGFDFLIVNAGSSGDTSAGGLRRLDWALDGDVRILILALGANDGLRGLSVAQMRENLASMIEQAQARGILVLLAGMEAMPNLGPGFTGPFREVYPELAEQYDTALVPFLLAGVAGDPTLNQSDGIHPNAEGARLVADVLWPTLQPLLEAASNE